MEVLLVKKGALPRIEEMNIQGSKKVNVKVKVKVKIKVRPRDDGDYRIESQDSLVK